MASEEVPLLTNKDDFVYERFSPAKKRLLVAIVSWGGLVAFFTMGTFVPSIPQIARELSSTGEIISYSVSINILGGCLGGLLGSKYAKFYGRRPCYLWNLPVAIIGSLGVARAQNATQLICWRFIQAMGASPSLSVGAGVIGDIYKLEERGTALGSYFGTGLLGLALAPTVGGVTAHYFSWRAIHYGLAAFALGAVFCIYWSFPETSHPGTMGIDNYRQSGITHPRWRPILLNPFKQLLYLRAPNILAIPIMGGLFLLTDMTLLMTFAYTIGKRYDITNEATIGLCFLPLGIGNALGSPLAGWISDKILIRYREKRGYWYPEDRLRACLFGIFLPFTVLVPALITKYIPGRLGLSLNLLCLFINGVGTDIAFTPCGAYIVDILHSHSAEATAAVNALRSVVLAGSTAILLPTVNTYGYLFTSTTISLFALSGFGLASLVIVQGGSMGAWVDVGYTTTQNN